MWPDQLQWETSKADPSNHLKTDFIGPLHWFPAATDLIAWLSQEVDEGLNISKYHQQ